MGGLSIFNGTVIHVFRLFRLRHALGISLWTVTADASVACVHLVLWLTAILMYYGYFAPEPKAKEPTSIHHHDV